MAVFVSCQSVQSGGATSLSKNFSPAAGNTVIPIFCFQNSKSGVGTITQSSGDTMALTAAEEDNSSQYVVIGLALAVAGGSTTYTFAWSSGGNAMMFLVETTPLKSSGTLDKFSVLALHTGTSHQLGPTAAITDANEFAIACWNADSSSASTPSVDNSFNIPSGGDVMGSGVTDCRACFAYKEITSAPTVSLSTGATSTSVIGVLATLKLASAGFTPKFRKTLSGIGSKVGVRQPMNTMGFVKKNHIYVPSHYATGKLDLAA